MTIIVRLLNTLTSTCFVVCLPPQAYYVKILLQNYNAFGTPVSSTLCAFRMKGMVIIMSLFEQIQTDIFDENLFKNPPAAFRSIPFWSWNCKLDKEMMRRQITYFKEMGFGGFMMHSRTGLQTPYLGEEFMDAIKFCTEEAEKQGLYAWLYDEDRWPSGYAGGLVLKEDPSLCMRYLRWTPNDDTTALPEEQAVANGTHFFIAAYDVELDESGCLLSYRRIDRNESASGKKWFAFSCPKPKSGWFNGETYIDTMDPKAVRKFLDITHERYYKIIGNHFGKTAPAIFYDEPALQMAVNMPEALGTGEGNIPWSNTLPDAFAKRYDYNVLEHIPEMFWQLPDNKMSRTRHDLWDCISELFAGSFGAQIAEWCRKHNIKCTGHYLFEDILDKQIAYSGDLMRQYRSMDIPGVDRLGYSKVTSGLASLAARSVAHQYGRRDIVSELYGISNWEFDFRAFKHIGDWEAVMGATIRVPHLAYLSMVGECKRDFPASINYQSPWYKEFPVIEDHFARLNTIMTRGCPEVSVAVLHCIESGWMLYGPDDKTKNRRQELFDRYFKLCSWITKGHVDCDILSESLLPELFDFEQDSVGLTVGKMTYKTVIIPEGYISIRETTVNALKTLVKNGGRIIFVGDCPHCFNETAEKELAELYAKSIVISYNQEELLEALESDRTVGIYNDFGEQDSCYLYQLRTDGKRKWLFIATMTSGDDLTKEGRNVKIIVDGDFCPKVYNTLNGTIENIPYEVQNGKTVINTVLYSQDSLLLCLEPQSDFTYEKEVVVSKKVLWTKIIDEPVKYSLSEPNVLLMDNAEYAIDQETYQPTKNLLKITLAEKDRLGIKNNGTQPWAQEEVPAEHTLHLRFTINSDIDCSDVYLGIENPTNTEIIWNEEIVNSKCEEGWYIDEAIRKIRLPGLKKGKNILLLSMPFGIKTWAENCYLLGDFGVEVQGTSIKIINRPKTISLSSVTPQGLPFYGANLTYNIPLQTETTGTLRVKADSFVGALLRISIDGADAGIIAFQPYILDIPNVKPGNHILQITAFGTRYNTLACLHLTRDSVSNSSPKAFRTEGEGWVDIYRTHDFGLLESPEFSLLVN